jgi:hypothetical protein
MGLYTGEPGRDPAAEAPRAYLAARDLAERLHQDPSSAAAAEWLLEAALPLCEEFSDHAGLRRWRDDAARALEGAYRHAGIPGEPAGVPGLFEARSALAAADLVAAELAFKDVLHRRPECPAAIEGLRLVEEEQHSLLEKRKKLDAAGRVVQEAERNERRAWSVERKLEELAGICRWPEKTSEGVCPSCLFAERVTITVQGRVESRVEGCGYRRRVVHALGKPGDSTTLRRSEGTLLAKKFAEARGGERARIALEIESIFELYLSAPDRFA